MILTIRTDSMTATIASLSPAGEIIKQNQWEAGRKLSVQLPAAIDELLKSSNSDYSNLAGIIVYEGPGSFTGLRIGITIANTIAHKLNIPIVGSTDEGWIEDGIKQITGAKPGSIVMPVYGGEANITKPKK